MPTVLRAGGFRIVIFLPPREHEPPHVHVRSTSGEVVINLAVGSKPQMVRSTVGMRTNEVALAYWLVEEHTEQLLERWRALHG